MRGRFDARNEAHPLLRAHNDDPILPKPGDRLGGVRLLDVLGEGPVGRFYRARLEGALQLVAVNVLHRGWVTDASRVAAYFDDAHCVDQLAHPNIAALLEVAHKDDFTFAVLEPIEGESLRSLLEREGPQSMGRVLRFASQIAAATSAAHAVGVVHQNLRLENVMVVHEHEVDAVKVLDFGAGRLLPRRAEARTDVYALGVMLHELLTGRPPAQVPSRGLPAPLRRLIWACIAADPRNRPLSMRHVLDVLRALQWTQRSTSPLTGPRATRREPSRLRAAD